MLRPNCRKGDLIGIGAAVTRAVEMTWPPAYIDGRTLEAHRRLKINFDVNSVRLAEEAPLSSASI